MSHAEALGDPPRKSGTVQSVVRAVDLLRAVSTGSGPETTVASLAATCGLNRATAWRILTTMEDTGIVNCDRTTGRWSIGFGLAEIAGSIGVETLIRSAHGVLEKLSLQTGETASLAVVRSGRLTYVDEVAPASVVAASWRGRTVSLHATSSGKVLMAYSDDATIDRLLADPLTAHTPTTITDLDVLRREFEQIRSRGYAVCRGEFETSAYGVSAPIRGSDGRPLAVISVWGPHERLGEERFDVLGPLAVEAASEVIGPGR